MSSALRRVLFAIAIVTHSYAAPCAGASEPFPIDLGWLDAQRDFHAVGDGIHDDTVALRAALDVCARRAVAEHVTLSMPPGSYRLSDTLECPPGVTLQGAGADETLLILAPQSDGFDDRHAPRSCLAFPGTDNAESNLESQRNYVFDLTIAVSAGNPGAVAIQQKGATSLAARAVVLHSDDLAYAAVSIESTDPLFSFWENTRVIGFGYGLVARSHDASVIMINSELLHQRRAGIHNSGASVALERVRSDNTVPFIVNRRGGLVTVINSDLMGGDAETIGIDNEAALYARNLKERGYRKTVSQSSPPESPLELPARDYKWGYLDEFLSVHAVGASPSPEAPLRLPVELPPEPSRDGQHSDWVSITSFADRVREGDWAPALQAAIDSGAMTICFPQSGDVVLGSPVVLRGNVVHLFGTHNALRLMQGVDPRDAAIILESGQSHIVIERLHLPHLRHRSATALLVRDAPLGTVEAEPGCGKLFAANVSGPLRVTSGQQTWVRGLSIRAASSATPLVNDGGQLWILGCHAADAGVVLDSRNGARTELLGGWIDPQPEPADAPLIRNEDSELALTHVLSTRAGNVRPYAIDGRQGNAATFREYRWYGGRIIQNRYVSGPPAP